MPADSQPTPRASSLLTNKIGKFECRGEIWVERRCLSSNYRILEKAVATSFAFPIYELNEQKENRSRKLKRRPIHPDTRQNFSYISKQLYETETSLACSMWLDQKYRRFNKSTLATLCILMGRTSFLKENINNNQCIVYD